MKTVISASRRTDLPGRYIDRLIAFVRQGGADVANPFSGAVTHVDMRPEKVHTLVLWSKNFGSFLEHDRHFVDYRLYFLFTINDMPSLEPGVPSLNTRLEQAEEIARRYGSERIGWRFDPVVFRTGRPVSGVDDFERIGARLAGFGTKRAIFSFLDLYGKVKKRSDAYGLGLIDPPDSLKREFALSLAEKAAAIGMTLESCCETIAGVPGIRPSSCIDGRLLGMLAGEPASEAKDSGQRKACNCTASRDIGSYRDMPCKNGCLYCYANPVVPPNDGAGK